MKRHSIELSSTVGKVRCLFKVADNEWLYVFGFATHILSFKAQKPIGKTDIYNVLVAGGYLPTAQTTKHKKIKAKGGKF